MAITKPHNTILKSNLVYWCTCYSHVILTSLLALGRSASAQSLSLNWLSKAMNFWKRPYSRPKRSSSYRKDAKRSQNTHTMNICILFLLFFIFFIQEGFHEIHEDISCEQAIRISVWSSNTSFAIFRSLILFCFLLFLVLLSFLYFIHSFFHSFPSFAFILFSSMFLHFQVQFGIYSNTLYCQMHNTLLFIHLSTVINYAR